MDEKSPAAKRGWRRWIPTSEQIQHHRALRFLHPYLLNKTLWRWDKGAIARGVLVGVFSCFIPLPGQTLIAAGLGIALRSNLVLAIGISWLSNPITIPPMLYADYRVGRWLLHSAPAPEVHLTLHNLMAQLHHIGPPLLLGGLVNGLVAGLAGYAVAYLGAWLYTACQ